MIFFRHSWRTSLWGSLIFEVHSCLCEVHATHFKETTPIRDQGEWNVPENDRLWIARILMVNTRICMPYLLLEMEEKTSFWGRYCRNVKVPLIELALQYDIVRTYAQSFWCVPGHYSSKIFSGLNYAGTSGCCRWCLKKWYVWTWIIFDTWRQRKWMTFSSFPRTRTHFDVQIGMWVSPKTSFVV
jgi:hypothetical protein